MPLYKVEIIETRSSFAFVRAASPAAARSLVDTKIHEGECDDILRDMSLDDIGAGYVRKIEVVPEGYEIDFDDASADSSGGADKER